MTPGTADDEQLADLADAITALAHRLKNHCRAADGGSPLTGTEILVIRQVHGAPGASPTDVAGATGLSRSATSTALRTLEARGLVRREQSAQDARTARLHPTPAADENLRRVRAEWAGTLRRAGAVATDPAAQGVDALRALARALSAR
ncbi:MAG TPA: MarR family transcriptional regulator [Cellulomonas sp.]